LIAEIFQNEECRFFLPAITVIMNGCPVTLGRLFTNEHTPQRFYDFMPIPKIPRIFHLVDMDSLRTCDKLELIT